MYKFIFLLISTLLFATTTQLSNVTLQLKWKHQFQFAGYYMAKEKGFYKDAGLHVDINEFNNGINIVDTVIKHKATYGVGYPSVILKKANGANIILISAINQLSPHILLTKKSSNINSISDFKNKRLMIDSEAVSTASFIAMLKSNHLQLKDMTLQKPVFSLKPFIDGKTDIITAYISNEPYQLKQKGIEFNIYNPAKYGFDFYDDILFTSTQELKQHPKRVEAFKQASLKGWRYAYSHIDETVDVILKKYNTQHKTRDALLYEAQELKKLAYYNNAKLGDISKNKIERIVDVYNILGLVNFKNNIDDFIYQSRKTSILSSKQKSYLKKLGNIKVCVNTAKLPYEDIDSNGNYIGMNADYFNLLKKKFHTKFSFVETQNYKQSISFIKNGECDLLPLSNYSQDKKYLNFTSSYFKIPLVLATNNNAIFIDDFTKLSGKKITILKDDFYKNFLTTRYPKIKFIEVNNVKDGLKLIKSGRVYGYIGTLIDVSYNIQKSFLGELKISGELDKKLDLSIAVNKNNPQLFHIIQKLVTNVEDYEIQKIFNDWISVEYTKEIDYTLFFEAFGCVFIIILSILFLYKNERKLKNELEVKNIVFNTIINTIENPIIYKNRAGTFVSVNKAFAKNLLGVQVEDIVGKKLDDLHHILSKDEISFYKEQDKKLYKSKQNQTYETKIKLITTNKLRNFKIQKNLLYSNTGKIIGYVGFMYDITDMKNREKELEYIASIDPMTKLYNRRYFTQMSETILKIAKRERKPISIIMLDIDDFKKVNDTYGHKIGDDVIISIAKTLQNVGRKSDVVCRWGGEEFILLLPHTSISGAVTIAQKIRKDIKNINIIINDNKTIHVSVSIGVSSVDVQNQKVLDPALKQADDALYRAKEKGKDRVEL